MSERLTHSNLEVEIHCTFHPTLTIHCTYVICSSRLAYRAGVTKAVVSPDSGDGFLRGLSAAFDLGAEHALEDGAILEEEAALHVRLDLGMQSSVSTQIKALRNFLHLDNDEKLIYKGQTETTSGAWARVRRVGSGSHAQTRRF